MSVVSMVDLRFLYQQISCSDTQNSLTELSSSFSLARLSSKSSRSVSVRPLWKGLVGASGCALAKTGGVVFETAGDMGFGLLQGWAVVMDTEGSLQIGPVEQK